MDLDFSQTRRLYLAGTVAFPMPFPTVGKISIQPGNVTRSLRGAGEGSLLVVIEEQGGFERSTIRVMMAEDVAAIFFYKGEGNKVEDFENGEWMLGPAIKAEKKAERQRATARQDLKRGIVFIPEHRPVLTISETTQTAGAVGTPPMYPYCECEECE
jgi:hypothetical protein